MTKETNIAGICFDIFLVNRSLQVTDSTAPKANREYILKPSVPGLIINKTPIKPTIIATALFLPNDSFNTKLAAIVTTNGKACKIALTFAKGIFNRAVKKNW